MQIDQEFFKRIMAMTKELADVDIPLEHYLRSLLSALKPHAQRMRLERAEFLSILAQAFDCPPRDFEQEWLLIEDNVHSPATYEDVEMLLKRQAACLRNFPDDEVATGQIYLDNGECWNNFSVSMYLECAAAGARDNSRMRSRPAKVPLLSWADIRAFFWFGQSYE